MNSFVLTYMLQSCTFVFHFSYLDKTCHLSITWNWKWKSLSRVWLFATPWTVCSPWNSPGQNTGVGRLSLFQRIFPTQGSNPGLQHCWRILYQLIHKGSQRILKWVAYHFSSGSSDPGIELGSPALQADSSPTELWGKHYLRSCENFLLLTLSLKCLPQSIGQRFIPGENIF